MDVVKQLQCTIFFTAELDFFITVNGKKLFHICALNHIMNSTREERYHAYETPVQHVTNVVIITCCIPVIIYLPNSNPAIYHMNEMDWPWFT